MIMGIIVGVILGNAVLGAAFYMYKRKQVMDQYEQEKTEERIKNQAAACSCQSQSHQ